MIFEKVIMLLSLSEIITKATQMKTNPLKVEWLQKNNSISLRTILKIMYDKDVKLLIPTTPPPYKENPAVGVENMLYNETRRLRIFVKGGGYDDLNKLKRESLFISLLEDVDKGDAKLLVKMIAQKPLTGLPPSVIREAFPGLIPNEERKS
jgi:hypothetical protein